MPLPRPCQRRRPDPARSCHRPSLPRGPLLHPVRSQLDTADDAAPPPTTARANSRRRAIVTECAGGGELSSAGDVYSFGIVLLEIFIRKRPTDDVFKDGVNIARFVEMNFPDRIAQIVDPELLEEHDDVSQQTSSAMTQKRLECLISVLNNGLRCANPSPNARIDMQEVAARLHGIKDAYLNGN